MDQGSSAVFNCEKVFWTHVLAVFECREELQLKQRHMAAVQSVCVKLESRILMEDVLLLARLLHCVQKLAIADADMYLPALTDILKYVNSDEDQPRSFFRCIKIAEFDKKVSVLDKAGKRAIQEFLRTLGAILQADFKDETHILTCTVQQFIPGFTC